MRRALKILAAVLLSLILLVILVIGGVDIALNTGAGRAFAQHKINGLLAGEVHITGLGGHFPEDIKVASASIADRKGVWLTARQLDLRWDPLALVHRDVQVRSLSAASIDVLRRPVPSNKAKKNSKSSLPKLQLNVDHLAVPRFSLAGDVTGEPVTLDVNGSTHFENQTHGSVTLNATAQNGAAAYHLLGQINAKTVGLEAHIAEPPDGLIGRYAGKLVHAPLTVNVALHGPRDDAALQFDLALGAAKLHGAGTLGLNPTSPKADVVLTIPALAPFAAIANRSIAGNTKLHLVIAHQANGGSTLALDGDVALTQAPDHLAKLVGQSGHLVLQAALAHNTVDIHKLDVSGADFDIAGSGTVARSGVQLKTHIALSDLSAISPRISGQLEENGTVSGPTKDFAIHAVLTGDIAQKGIRSGPFTITVDARHLPKTPTGTLTGTGALENYPLTLDADFARQADGAATLVLNKADWRSLSATADLALAPGAKLPTGTAKFKIGSLADFRPFAPLPLAGSVTGDFAHADTQSFALDLTARRLVVNPKLGPVDATMHAKGPPQAIALRAQASVARLMSSPARLDLAGVLNLDKRSADLTALHASWHQLNAVLQGPARITTKPEMAVQHLALGLNGGRITVNGTLSPRLNATLTVQHLPASLARLISPKVDVSGTLSANAVLTGTKSAPRGRIALQARAIKLHSGPAASLPPADATVQLTLAGKTAKIAAQVSAGQNISLAADGTVPMRKTGPIDLHVTGRTDLRLVDPILAARGTLVHGIVNANLTVTGTTRKPNANGFVTLANGSVENIGSGLNLTAISARVAAAGRTITLQRLAATAGKGSISGHGTIDLGAPTMPVNIAIGAQSATLIASDIVTEKIDAALTVAGALKGGMTVGGNIKIDSANINIPKSLPPSVAKLPIQNEGAPRPPPAPPAPPIQLNLDVSAPNQIFIRGDGLFAELGGNLKLTGTAAHPVPMGGFKLIRGSFALAGKSLQFTSGTISFNGGGFMPTLDLEATVVSASQTATLVIGGTAAKPTITLTSSPPLPSDQILAQLLFGESTANLTPFQAASLAAALAQLTGVGGGVNPLDSVRNALGLDQLSLGGSGNGPPSVQAGRYVAPGVYVGATQATNGQGTQARVEINLYKGLKLKTTTGSSSTGTGDSSSVGLTYQFNY
jgi:translocation and assembly module TamB